MEADIVECDELEESEDRDTFQGMGPIPKHFLLSSIHLFICFLVKDFYSATVIILRFQGLEAFVFCRCFDAQQYVVTPAYRGRHPVSLWTPHLHPESLHFTLHIINATAVSKNKKTKQKQTPVWFEKCDACV